MSVQFEFTSKRKEKPQKGKNEHRQRNMYLGLLGFYVVTSVALLGGGMIHHQSINSVSLGQNVTSNQAVESSITVDKVEVTPSREVKVILKVNDSQYDFLPKEALASAIVGKARGKVEAKYINDRYIEITTPKLPKNAGNALELSGSLINQQVSDDVSGQSSSSDIGEFDLTINLTEAKYQVKSLSPVTKKIYDEIVERDGVKEVKTKIANDQKAIKSAQDSIDTANKQIQTLQKKRKTLTVASDIAQVQNQIGNLKNTIQNYQSNLEQAKEKLSEDQKTLAQQKEQYAKVNE